MEDKDISKQPRFQPTDIDQFVSWFHNSHAADKIPPLNADNRARDLFLNEFWTTENHLTGVLNSVVAIDKNRAYTLVGGRNQVNRYQSILANVEAGAGWHTFMSKAALDYYTTGMGAVVEIGRTQENGPLHTLYNVDALKCSRTQNPIAPLAYHPDTAKVQYWRPEDYMSMTSLPSPRENLAGIGHCAVDRVFDAACLMAAVYAHDREELGAQAPKGLLLLQNISQTQWDMAMAARKRDRAARELEWFGGVAVLAQETAEKPDARLIGLSQLPAHFDRDTFINSYMYLVALCFGFDAQEFWPVNSGALGRGKETDIQHRKSFTKGAQDYTAAFQQRLQQELPPTVLFEFVQRDAEGELLDATLHAKWAEVAQKIQPIIGDEYASAYLAEHGVIPSDWTSYEEDAIADSSGKQRMLRRLREQYHESAFVHRAAHMQPNEPIVRYTFPSHTMTVLWETGDAFFSAEQHWYQIQQRTAEELAAVEDPESPVEDAEEVVFVYEDEDEDDEGDEPVVFTIGDLREALNSVPRMAKYAIAHSADEEEGDEDDAN